MKQFVTTETGEQVAVILDLDTYRDLLKAAEKAHDITAPLTGDEEYFAKITASLYKNCQGTLGSSSAPSD